MSNFLRKQHLLISWLYSSLCLQSVSSLEHDVAASSPSMQHFSDTVMYQGSQKIIKNNRLTFDLNSILSEESIDEKKSNISDSTSLTTEI